MFCFYCSNYGSTEITGPNLKLYRSNFEHMTLCWLWLEANKFCQISLLKLNMVMPITLPIRQLEYMCKCCELINPMTRMH